jgi:hypothetical protein
MPIAVKSGEKARSVDRGDDGDRAANREERDKSGDKLKHDRQHGGQQRLVE